MKNWNAHKTENEQGTDLKEIRLNGKVSHLKFTIKPKSSYWRAGFKLVDPNSSFIPLRNKNSLLFHLASASDEEYVFIAYLNGDLIENLHKIKKYPSNKSLTIKLEINHNNYLKVYVNESLEFKPHWNLPNPNIREKVALIAWGDENDFQVEFKNIKAGNWKYVQKKKQKYSEKNLSIVKNKILKRDSTFYQKKVWYQSPKYLGLVFAFISVIIGIISIPWWPQVFKFAGTISSRFGISTKNTDAYKKLESLSPHMNISYFIDVLGKPTISKTEEDGLVKYFTFIDPRFYLFAATDKDDNVIYFAVTSRKNDFQPSFKRPDDYNNTYKDIILNKTTFLDVDNPNDQLAPSCFFSLGVRRFFYFEGYYEANPGKYQSFYIGINDAGYINENLQEYIPGLEDQVQFNQLNGCSKIPINFREKIPINTYIVTDAFQFMPDSSDAGKLRLGVDLDEVRIIKQ